MQITHDFRAHCESFVYVLNADVRHSESDIEAQQSQKKLFDLVQQLLESNHDISRRLRGLEDMFDAESIQTVCFRNGTSVELVERNIQAGDVTPRQKSSLYALDSSGRHERTSFRPSFQIDLEASRVYMRTQLYQSDVSFTTSIVRTHAWSIFSKISLSQVSCISAIALPVYSDDISNGELYQFGFHEQSEASCTSAAPRSPFFGPLSTEMGWLDTMDLTDSDCPILETSQAAVGTEYTSRRLSSPPAQWVRQRHRLAVLGDRESRKLEFVNQVCSGLAMFHPGTFHGTFQPVSIGIR